MRSLTEAASAVLSTFGKRKVVYVNFLTEIQPECDCMPGADVPMVQDLGILVSDDLVAVEQASMDMIRSAKPLPGSAASDRGIASGQDILAEFHKKPYYLQIEEAERLGLGSRKYDIIDI
ncbi:MAG: hypothetical protein GWO38_03880 [Phycisphaerae bacterium]|nr:hypothetical protein [Phycisphaerae bacterium]NIP50949.1 hypothetical protein [Phycisphaerae bacterium]NIW41590.1 hypothetical protein [candidate division Zixibacteria bacterium]NIW97339.1 hypothetical protein [Phycisphaerae bacterium]NIX26781.1 hypothetical protein [Phycisphaerae bacterium]